MTATAALSGSDLNLLVALRALLEQGNLTRAGAQLGAGQPAMSVALSRLRQHYGDELLVRVGREYELTPLARALLPEVQRAIPLIERALKLDDETAPAASTRTFDVALSDYVSILLEPHLRQGFTARSPGASLRLHQIPRDMHVRELGLLEFDVMVAPLGFGFIGESLELFRDRFVCIVDRNHPALVDGALSLDAFRELGHARAVKGTAHLTPYERHLAEIGVKTEVRVTATGWLPLPFVVSGTELIGIVPERLARRMAPLTGIAVVEPPFGDVALVEALWWHPSRDGDPANRWLRRLVQDAAGALDAAAPPRISPPGS
jgi:DNA-binding transcriptional LysR family regulator